MPKRRSGREIPSSKNKFIDDFLHSIKKRGKSLKHKTSFMSCDKVFTEEEGVRLEKVELKLSPGHSASASCTLEIHVWEDRWIRLLFSEWKDNAWDWSWNIEGSILPVYDGKSIIEAIESTLLQSFEMSASSTNRFDQVWRPILAREPELVR
ncbi:hypothetical protein FKG94_26990 [Exilibacterium tricleocarpae]|uniref:Uncharacterized protein n=1 Tax=Exilibacterium tricleocarpae TaxID=2591008 RepID=A0A545SNB6_9GAMM|nr:hypothetical protein [Exilibacterium tricleocarpae]TQV66482.1 hypothetical protein FKG94_26990 [Exilibacterium tricleocarpae]